MGMKKISLEKYIASLTILLLGLSIVGCRSELINPEREYTGTKELHLTYSNETQSQVLKIDTAATLKLLLKTTKRYKEDLVVKLKLEGFEGITLSPSTITIPAGEIKALQDVRVRSAERVKERMKGVITLDEIPDGTIIKKQVSLLIDTLENLTPTDEELALLEHWKKAFGIDLKPFIGKMLCNGTVDETGEDLLDFFMKPRHINIDNQEMIVGVSKMATKDQPMLAFRTNALGLASYWKEVWLALTWENRVYWNDPDNIYVAPAAKVIIKALQWKEETPVEFDVAMPIIKIDTKEKGKIYFTGTKVQALTGRIPDEKYSQADLEKMAQELDPVFELYYNYYPNPITKEPAEDNALMFKVPLFQKAVELAKKDPELYTAIREGSFSPFQVMDTKTIAYDVWAKDGEIEVTHYEKPKGTIDFDKKEIYIRTVSCLENSGYTVIDIHCKVMEE